MTTGAPKSSDLASSHLTARAKTTTEPKAASPAQENGAAITESQSTLTTPPPTSRANVGAETKDVSPEVNGRPIPSPESSGLAADQNGRANVAAESIRAAPAQSAKTIRGSKTTAQSSSQELLFTIRTLGKLLDDLEAVRIMNGNRIDTMMDPVRGIGAVHHALPLVQESLKAIEHEAELELKRIWRKHPLRAWIRDYPGVGEKLIARLIAEIGDPGERPNPAKLWAYCGLGDPARKRKAGMTQEEAFRLGSPQAKKVCWLIGVSLTKKRCKNCTRAERARRDPKTPKVSAPWAPPPPDCTCAAEGCIGRVRYDAMRARYADRVHEKACVRCGPSGHPALPGSPWSPKHQGEAAKRYAVKMFLKDLWVASRQIHSETHQRLVGAK